MMVMLLLPSVTFQKELGRGETWGRRQTRDGVLVSVASHLRPSPQPAGSSHVCQWQLQLTPEQGQVKQRWGVRAADSDF